MKPGRTNLLVIFSAAILIGISFSLFQAYAQNKTEQPSSADVAAEPAGLIAARQMILVTTKDWNAVDGLMQRYERSSAKRPWRKVGEKIPIVVGRNGLAWGKGLHGDTVGEGPIKKEGDGRSPAGVFSLSSAFGYASKDQADKLKLPYVQATDSLECVDDVNSSHYNQVLDRRAVTEPDWKSSEQMRRKDEFYRWGVIVDHNPTGEPGCGSCIFMHIWAGAGQGTSGCTAMTQAKIKETLTWLSSKRHPVLVQLPLSEFDRLRDSWKLPGR